MNNIIHVQQMDIKDMIGRDHRKKNGKSKRNIENIERELLTRKRTLQNGKKHQGRNTSTQDQ
jgi:hypothetical protein